MIKRRHQAPIIFLFVVALGWMACTQERQPCGQPKTAKLNMHCYQIAGIDTNNIPIVRDTALPNPVVAFIDTAGIAVPYYYGLHTLAYFTIFLSPAADSCRWLISTDSTAATLDTMIFYYQRKITFLSNSCGYTYFYNLQHVATTNHSIDSVIVENSNVTNNANVEHLKIYINP